MRPHPHRPQASTALALVLAAAALAGAPAAAEPGTDLGADLGAGPGAGVEAAPEAAGPPMLHVTRTPGCGCCAAWATLARGHGFAVEMTETQDIEAVKREAGVPAALRSCHTARVAGYVIEGHVPFAAIDRLLAERPAIGGLSVPGMPIGSPGMGDDPAARYDVMAFGGTAGGGATFERVGE